MTKPCTGLPAEEFAEAYVEGSLDQAQMDRFEDHFFECELCLQRVQLLQAAAAQLAHSEVAAAEPVQPQRIALVPTRPRRFAFAWGGALALAAAAIVGVVAFSAMHRNEATTTATVAAPNSAVPQTQGAQPSASASAASPVAHTTAELSGLADLSWSPYSAPVLRGEGVDANFAAGMQAYEKRDCHAAVRTLSAVSEAAPEAPQAHFYTAVCDLHLGQLDAAATIFTSLAADESAPLHEAALYSLAQVELKRGHTEAAAASLRRTVRLHGDFERRASAELQKLNAAAASQPK